MPIPPPPPDRARLTPPDAVEVRILSEGVASAVAPADGLTATQRLLLQALFKAMTGHPATLDRVGADPAWFARCLQARTTEFRTRIVQIMVLLGLVLRPLPTDVADRIAAFARELCVDEDMLDVARGFAEGSLGLAARDFERNGYLARLESGGTAVLHTSTTLESAWAADYDDPALTQRWRAMEDLPAGSLGRRVTEFYRARGFAYPGLPGSAPPLLAQHDWVHVAADYGTTVESELEVFALIARANDDLRAFSLLAMVVSLFETGYLQHGAGLFDASPGHLSQGGMATRVSDAMRRGALCQGSIDFMGLDWFELAELPVLTVRDQFRMPPKAREAITAGSVGPWQPGGISPFQVRAGTSLAEQQGQPYESFGASPIGPSE
jgi:hypothetical protein